MYEYPVRPELTSDIINRFRYHKANEERGERHQFVREALELTAHKVMRVIPETREASLFLTKLEEAMFWANAAIARES